MYCVYIAELQNTWDINPWCTDKLLQTENDKWQTRPLVRGGAPQRWDSNFQTTTFGQKIISGRKSQMGSTPRHTDWLTVSRTSYFVVLPELVLLAKDEETIVVLTQEAPGSVVVQSLERTFDNLRHSRWMRRRKIRLSTRLSSWRAGAGNRRGLLGRRASLVPAESPQQGAEWTRPPPVGTEHCPV
jgi:hypothetical protein